MPRKYENDKKLTLCLRITYITFFLIWIMLVLWFEIYKIGGWCWVLILIPLLIFMSGYTMAPVIQPSHENQIFEASFLAIGLLVLMPLVNWMRDDYNGDCRYFINLVILGIALTLFSVIDFWTPHKYIRVLKHIRLCFETMAVVIFLIVLYLFVINSVARSCTNVLV